jgi:hypothetical protein
MPAGSHRSSVREEIDDREYAAIGFGDTDHPSMRDEAKARSAGTIPRKGFHSSG